MVKKRSKLNSVQSIPIQIIDKKKLSKKSLKKFARNPMGLINYDILSNVLTDTFNVYKKHKLNQEEIEFVVLQQDKICKRAAIQISLKQIEDVNQTDPHNWSKDTGQRSYLG